DPRAEHVRTCKVKRVFGRLEQRDRTPDVPERGAGTSLHLGEARQRPVDADPHVGIVERAGGLERVVDDRLGAREVARVRERIAERHAVPDLRRRILRSLLDDLLEAALEELDLLLKTTDGAVCATEREVDVDPLDRGRAVDYEGFLEA